VQRSRDLNNNLSTHTGYQMGYALGACGFLTDEPWRKGVGGGDPSVMSFLRGVAEFIECWNGPEGLGADPPPA
jgi:hypothetical protein